MAITPTRYSRISTGWRSSSQSLADYDPADTGADFSCINGAVTGTWAQTGAATYSSTLSVNGASTFQSTVTTRGTLTAGTFLAQSAATFNSTLSADGAATFQSTLTARGQVNADAGVQVGGGTVMQILSSATTQLSFGAIGVSGGVSTVTVALSGISRGDYVHIIPDANWFNTAANRPIHVFASSSSTVGEANVWAVNSGLSAVTPTANTLFRLIRMKFGNYPAA